MIQSPPANFHIALLLQPNPFPTSHSSPEPISAYLEWHPYEIVLLLVVTPGKFCCYVSKRNLIEKTALPLFLQLVALVFNSNRISHKINFTWSEKICSPRGSDKTCYTMESLN